MSKRKIETSENRAANIQTIYKRENLTQTEFAESLGVSQQRISEILKKNTVSEYYIDLIAEKYPDYNINWIRGESPYMLKADLNKEYVKRKDAANNAYLFILDDALQKVCAQDNIKVPVLDNIPELLLLESQLKDYALFLMRNYVIDRSESEVWNYLDHLDHIS